jgi:hypothetical protein
MLITRYPPIRDAFLHHDSLRGVQEPHKEVLALWEREIEPRKGDWLGFYQLAAASLCGDIPQILQKVPVAAWGKVFSDELNVIDELLTKFSSEYVYTTPPGRVFDLPKHYLSES